MEAIEFILFFSNNTFIVEQLGDAIAKAKNLDPKDFRILEITNFSNINFYYDMNFDPKPKNSIPCFTFQNIHPEHIKFPVDES